MRVVWASVGAGLAISSVVLWLSWNYSHNAAIGVPVNLLSLPFLPGTLLCALTGALSATHPNITWTCLSLMLASGAVFYGFLAFLAWSAVTATRRR